MAVVVVLFTDQYRSDLGRLTPRDFLLLNVTTSDPSPPEPPLGLDSGLGRRGYIIIRARLRPVRWPASYANLLCKYELRAHAERRRGDVDKNEKHDSLCMSLHVSRMTNEKGTFDIHA